MSLPTASDLIECLRAHYAKKAKRQTLPDEELAPHLPFKLRQLARWKKNDVDYFNSVMGMLHTAGWLNEKTIDRSLRKLAEARQAADEGGEVAARLQREQPPPAGQARSSTSR